MCHSVEMEEVDEYEEFISKRFSKIIYAAVNEHEHVEAVATRDMDKARAYAIDYFQTQGIAKEVKTFHFHQIITENIAVYTDGNYNGKYEVEALDSEGLGIIYPCYDCDDFSEDDS